MALLEFGDVVVSPFTELLDSPRGGSPHKGGPHWPEWESQREARHIRGERPIDDPPMPVQPVATIGEEVAWGGPLVGQFGHQVAEFSMRIVPMLSERPRAMLLFAAKPQTFPSIRSVPTWIWDIHAWLGLDHAQVRLVDQPVLCRRLLVAPQAEPLGGQPSAEHLDRMDRLVSRRLGRLRRSGTLYVSRAGLSRRLAGEVVLERAFAACGVRIIRPERHAIAEQLAAYSRAASLIFAEGSAVHAIQLLGRSLGDVHIIVRRPGDRIGARSLRSRGISMSYHETAALLHGFLPNGQAATPLGIPVLDPARLAMALEQAVPGLAAAFDADAFREAAMVDVQEWLDALQPRSLDGPPVGVITPEGSWRLDITEAAEYAAKVVRGRASEPET